LRYKNFWRLCGCCWIR